MRILSTRYKTVLEHKGIGICTLVIAYPEQGDDLGYVIDHEHFAWRRYDHPEEAMGAIDEALGQGADLYAPIGIYGNYIRMFETKLALCKKKYNPLDPYANLEVCCQYCKKSLENLFGAVELMVESGMMTAEQEEAEIKYILDKFSTIRLFHAIQDEGEVRVFVRRKEED